MPLELFHDTIAAIATAEGRGALTIVRISGEDAILIVSKIVSDAESLLTARGGSSIYTNVLRPVSGTRAPDKKMPFDPALGPAHIDDVIIHVFRAPRSFTGEDLCEITCHGSPVIAGEIISLLMANGARVAEPGEFSRRAFFNGKLSIEQAELISIKANAQSERELRGAELAISEKYDRLRAAYKGLIALIARIDAEIDFGDSDAVIIVDFAERVAEIMAHLRGLLRDSSNRRENAGYFTIALTGPPNVGKSSIFNALLNFERSIVSEAPGTTRDYVEAYIHVDGFRVKLIDTAGLRTVNEAIESRGIELGKDAARYADVTFRVTVPGDRSPQDSKDAVFLHNKVDLDGWNQNLCVSALTGEGIESLYGWLSRELYAHSSELSQIQINDDERAKLNSVIASLDSINLDLEPALLSDELRTSVGMLSSLLGMNVSNDSLNHIFSEMCIGK